MSSDRQEFNLKMVCLQAVDKSKTVTYAKNVSIGILFDTQRRCLYCRIRANGKVLLTIELAKLRWMPQSSAAGVATIRTIHHTVVATYDATDNALTGFFAHLQETLAHDTDTHTTRKPSELWIDSLIRSIHEGSAEKAEYYATQLAESKANIQFNLANTKVEKSTVSDSAPDDKSHPESILQLTLQIECHMDSNPSKVPIAVRSGTTLRSLKAQIAKETGIASEDQFWFASRRYPLANDYVFGSSEPVGLAQSQMQPPVNPVRSGDTLIMYIIRSPPLY